MGIRSSLLLIALAIATPAAAKMYKWVDENGQVTYSQTPPPGGLPTEEVKPPPKPAEDPEKARQRFEERFGAKPEEKPEGEGAGDHPPGDDKAEKPKLDEKARQQNCRAARKNLQAYEGPPQRRFAKADGSVETLTAEEQRKRLEEARRMIKEYCN